MGREIGNLVSKQSDLQAQPSPCSPGHQPSTVLPQLGPSCPDSSLSWPLEVQLSLDDDDDNIEGPKW